MEHFQAIKRLYPLIQQVIKLLDSVIDLPLVNEAWVNANLLTDMAIELNGHGEQVLVLYFDNLHRIVYNPFTLQIEDYELGSYRSVMSYSVQGFRDFDPALLN